MSLTAAPAAPAASSGAVAAPASQAAAATSAAAASSSQAAAPPQASALFGSLERAAGTLSGLTQEDERWADLAECLNAAQYAYRVHLAAPWAAIEKRRVLSIPDAVIEASTAAEAHAAQGLFPSISRAWIVIDTRLYLWNYLDGSNGAFESYEHPDSVIQSVGLVKPKSGVFIDAISHILVICTNASITLLGLAFETGANSATTGPELKLYVTDMSVQTDGVTMSGVRGTDDGRVFCKGSDGNAYEVLYQAAEGWFSAKCSVRNLSTPRFSSLVPTFLQGSRKEPLDFLAVDGQRGALYTLHRKAEIEVWVLPKTGAPPTQVARAKDICRQAALMCPNTTLLGAADFAVVWLGVVPSAESRTVHLVALTSKGVRLYFSHSRTRYGAEGPPTCLELLYVRPPPPAGQQGEPAAPGAAPSDHAPTVPSFTGVQHALYSSGTLLAAAPYAPDAAGATDVVLGIARPASSTRLSVPGAITATGSVGMGMSSNATVGPEADSATCVLVRGATWDIAEVPRNSPAPAPANGRISPLALQVITPPRVFLVLTSSGLSILTELRPLDTLRSLLETGNVFDQSVHEFFNRYGQAQSCAMALAIASRNSQLLVAPESCLVSDSETAARTTAPRVLSPEAVSHAWRIFFDYGGHPRYDPPPYPSQPPSDGKVTLSGRYHGLTIYLARLIRPFWAQLITRKVTLPGEGERQQPNVGAPLLAAAQQDLRSLDEFLNRNAQLFGIGSGSKGRSSSAAPEGEQVAFRAEQTDFDAVRALLSRTLEAISFILLLIDYQMPRLVSRCKPELQTQLAKLSFSDLITTPAGAETARGLVEAIIDSQIAMSVSIDAVADVLQERCGSFCNADDVRLYKALECIRRAKGARDDASRSAALNESAKLLVRATKTLPFDKLERICQDYRELQFDLGAIELPLRCAAEWDPHGVARSYRADGMPETDAARKPVYEMSLRCYQLVIDTLASLDPKPAAPGSASAQQQAAQRLDVRRVDAYAQAQASQDALFHVALYDWLLQRRATDELLRMRTPFIEDYLRSEPVTLERCLLLCDWYVSVGQNFAAAQVYAGLAQSTELPLSLDDRVEYLTKASSNSKSAFTHSHDIVTFTTEVDEKLDVARVQVEVFRAIEENEHIEQAQKDALLKALNAELFDISTLYRDFAEPENMYEVQLMIFHVSDHRDPELVRNAWQALLDEAHNSSEDAPERAYERVASVVVELGKRFLTSEIAFPLDLLTDELERYAFSVRERQRIPAGWAVRTMLTVGAPPEIVYDVLESAFQTKREPWHTHAGLVQLLSSLSTLIRIWLDETLGVADAGGPRIGSAVDRDFPAARVEAGISAYLVALASLPRHTAGAADRDPEAVAAELKQLQERIRRTF